MVVNSPRAIFCFFPRARGRGVKKGQSIKHVWIWEQDVPRVPESCAAATAAIMLHIYFDLRTYALGRLVKRLLGARASERQWPHLHRVFRFALVRSSLSLYPLALLLSLCLSAWNLILSPLHFHPRPFITHTRLHVNIYVVILLSLRTWYGRNNNKKKKKPKRRLKYIIWKYKLSDTKWHLISFDI